MHNITIINSVFTNNTISVEGKGLYIYSYTGTHNLTISLIVHLPTIQLVVKQDLDLEVGCTLLLALVHVIYYTLLIVHILTIQLVAMEEDCTYTLTLVHIT